jgi:thymidylate synthase
MRSSDAWLGLPNDIGVFALMAQYVAEKLDITSDQMYLNMHSSHLYNKDCDNAEDIVKTYKEML